jgi:hypothetical protein
MAHWFDDLAVSVAEGSSRRSALRKVGAGVVGAVGLLVLGGSRGEAWGTRADDDDEERRNKERCDPGLMRCDSTCAAIAIDPDNCGGCGKTCASGQVCRRGRCVTECPPASCNHVTCPPGVVACGSICCRAGETCRNGMCQLSCAPLTNCAGMCKDTQVDPQNCGTCGTVCGMGMTCVMGICTCAPGTTKCNNMCVDTGTSLNNCGGCGVVCAPPHATGLCMAGRCTIAACNAGFANCDGLVANGCEVDLLTDNNNCGTCGRVCGVCATCSMGTCMPKPAGTPCPGGGTCNPVGMCVPPGG